MSAPSALSFVEALRSLQLLEPHQLEELQRTLGDRDIDPRELAKDLVQRGWLTNYQVSQVFRGKGKELVLGAYVLLEPIGAGGMGQVFKARHRTLDRICALKAIRRELLLNPDTVNRFLREAKAAARLSHPNIVTVYDADQTDGNYYLVMEYVAGIDLAQLVAQRGALPVPWACAYIRQAALGLQHAFERGLVHRDIKPQNLLLHTESGLIKILDLGLARVTEVEHRATLTQQGAFMGTPAYMAPEQGLDAHSADIRSDIYSLGCTLFHLLTGRPPFEGPTPMVVFASHLRQAPPTLTECGLAVPPGLEMVLARMMAKRPEQRYQTPSEVAVALAPFVTAPSRTAVQTTQPPVLLHPDPNAETNVVPGARVRAPASVTYAERPHVRPPSRPVRPRAVVPPRRHPYLVPLVLFVGLVIGALGTAALMGWKPWDRFLAGGGTKGREEVAGQTTKAPRLRLEAADELTMQTGEAKRLTFRLARGETSGPVTVQLTGQPAQIAAPETTVPAGSSEGEIAVTVPPLAEVGSWDLRLRASIGAETAENKVRLTVTASAALQHYQRGDALMKDHDYAAAAEAFAAAVRADAKFAAAHVQLAAAYNKQYKSDEALAAGNAALQLEPRNAPALLQRAIAYTLKFNTDLAFADCDAALKIDPKLAAAYRVRGVAYYSKGDADRAIAELDEAIRLDPKDADAFVQRARVYGHFPKDDFDKAVADYGEALRLDPKNINAYRDRGGLYRGKLQFDKAAADFTEVIRLSPKKADAYQLRAGLYCYDMRDYPRAFADYAEAIRLEPKNPWAYSARAHAYQTKGDYLLAIADFSEAIRLEPDNQWLYHDRAYVYELTADYDRAIADYTETIRRDPQNAFNYQKRARIYSTFKRDYNQAIADYSEAIRLSPGNSYTYVDRARVYELKADYDRAIADCTEAIRLDPKNRVAWSQRGEEHRLKGEFDKAIDDSTEAIRLEPQDSFSYATRGVAYRQKGDSDAALRDLNEAIRLTPNYGWAYFHRAYTYAAKGEDDQAIADYTEAIRHYPQDHAAYNNRGLLYKKKGKLDLAIADYTKAIELKPDLPLYYDNRAYAYDDKGDTVSAAADRRKAADLKSKTPAPALPVP